MNGAGAISDNSFEQSRVMRGERYGTTIWIELLEKNKRPVIMPKVHRKERLHGYQKAMIPPPHIRNGRGTEMRYDFIMQQVNSLSHWKQRKVSRRIPGKEATLTAGTKIVIRPQDAAQTVEYGNRRRRHGRIRQPSAQRHACAFITESEYSVMANLPKAGRENMQQKTPDKFFRSDGHRFHFVSVSIIPPTEADFPVLHTQNSVVGNCHSVGITSKICNDFLRRSKWRFAVYHPFLRVAGIQQGLIGVRKFLFHQRQKLPPKLCGKNTDGEEKLLL